MVEIELKIWLGLFVYNPHVIAVRRENPPPNLHVGNNQRIMVWNLRPHMNNWLEKNITGSYWIYMPTNWNKNIYEEEYWFFETMVIKFENKSDAILFKLSCL